jgi:hypothetical protein
MLIFFKHIGQIDLWIGRKLFNGENTEISSKSLL